MFTCVLISRVGGGKSLFVSTELRPGRRRGTFLSPPALTYGDGVTAGAESELVLALQCHPQGKGREKQKTTEHAAATETNPSA